MLSSTGAFTATPSSNGDYPANTARRKENMETMLDPIKGGLAALPESVALTVLHTLTYVFDTLALHAQLRALLLNKLLEERRREWEQQ
jgi:hypothetical protein